MAEETKETKGFGNWVREHSRELVMTGVLGVGLFVGYEINNNHRQDKAYVRALESVVLQDPNLSRALVGSMKPKELVKEEKKEIEKEAKEMAKDSNKYALVLEKRIKLEEENDALTAEKRALTQKYDVLSKEQAPLMQKYNKTLEDLTATLTQKAALEAKQKELIKQFTDVNETTVKLTGENNKLNRIYVAEAEARKKSDANSVEVNVKLVDLNKKYLQLSEEKSKLEKDIIEKYVPALDAYNILSRQRGIFKPAESAESRRPKVESERATEETKYDLLALQVGAIKRSKEAAIVFLKGNLTEVDNKRSDFFERTDGSSVEEIVNRYSEGSDRYALLGDTDGDGIKDVLYKRGAGIVLKKGRRDGTFAPAEKVSSEFSQEVQKKYILKGLGFD